MGPPPSRWKRASPKSSDMMGVDTPRLDSATRPENDLFDLLMIRFRCSTAYEFEHSASEFVAGDRQPLFDCRREHGCGSSLTGSPIQHGVTAT